MSELKSIKLNPESQLFLDQPLLRLPFELHRKNFQNARRAIEREREAIMAGLRNLSKETGSPRSAEATTETLNTMINRMQGLKRKLEVIEQEDKMLHKQSKKRIEHLQELYEIPSLADVKFDRWSRSRLDRLLADYMLRTGYIDSAVALAKDRGIEDLVDINPFVQYTKIRESLKRRSTQECLSWCVENRHSLKKISSNIEFEIRLQQYVELVRTREPMKLLEATLFARKYFAPHQAALSEEIRNAAGLLAYPTDTDIEPYATFYSPLRWEHIAEIFTEAHHGLLSLPDRPLLHIALSAGLSSLKTPSCHSKIASSSSNANSSMTTVCPICSTELNELARQVPYAHQTKSHVDNDPVVLPNGRIYGRDRLMDLNRKFGLPEDRIKDPTEGTVFDVSDVKKVYIS